ncbi:hypothetical protein RhiirB3_532896 [Rhizophagus irregularis]|nr:hypothetical protein RhiirB3_532896 [Rhizophagus irregularis]
MRIINYYGKSGRVTLDNFNQEVKIYFDKIKELVRESKAQNAEIILLGDFNLHYEKYLDDKNNNRKMKKEHKLFEWIEDEQNFYDPFYIMFDNLSQHSLNTFYPFNTNQNPSRIDYIWVTENLFSETQECKIVNTTTINTDHRMLVYSIWSEDLIGNIANIKRKEGFKEVYKYDKMDGEQWELFQNDLNKYISNSEILKFNFNDKNNINHIWDKIKKGLVQASKNCIPIEKIKLTKRSTNQPKILSEYWAKFYFPQDEINDKIYKDLMVEPTNDELNEALNKLSNNKASGPTGISNEMLKHASPEFKEIIRKLIILIFNNQEIRDWNRLSLLESILESINRRLIVNRNYTTVEIPLEWKYANVYPIPKPKPWGCQATS